MDGYRALAIKTGGKIQLRSRNDNDFSVRYPAIAKALSLLPNETVVDGEVVALMNQVSRRSTPCKIMRQVRRFISSCSTC